MKIITINSENDLPKRPAEYFVYVDDYKSVAIFDGKHFFSDDNILHVTRWIDMTEDEVNANKNLFTLRQMQTATLNAFVAGYANPQLDTTDLLGFHNDWFNDNFNENENSIQPQEQSEGTTHHLYNASREDAEIEELSNPSTENLTSEEIVAEAWRALAKLDKENVCNDEKLGTCFPAHSVLKALEMVSKLSNKNIKETYDINAIYDLTGLTQEEKNKLISDFLKYSSSLFLQMYLSLDLKDGMKATVINDGKYYTLSFMNNEGSVENLKSIPIPKDEKQ